MEIIQPEVLIHRNAAIRIESVLCWSTTLIRRTVIGGILIYGCLAEHGRILKHGSKDGVGVEVEYGSIPVCTRQPPRHSSEVMIELFNVKLL